MDLMKSLEFVSIEEQKPEVISALENAKNLIEHGEKLSKEKEYTFEEFKQEIAVATEVIEKEKDSKVIHSNKAITDYNKKVNRIKKRDSKPTEADLQRIEQAQKERQAKREKNLKREWEAVY